MALKLIWSEESITDIEAIAQYIEKDSAFYARTVVQKIRQQALKVTEFPEIGRVVPELKNDKIRELFVYSYRLIYTFSDESVIITAIIHGARDLIGVMERR